jgi:hypothetical protein
MSAFFVWIGQFATAAATSDGRRHAPAVEAVFFAKACDLSARW